MPVPGHDPDTVPTQSPTGGERSFRRLWYADLHAGLARGLEWAILGPSAPFSTPSFLAFDPPAWPIVRKLGPWPTKSALGGREAASVRFLGIQPLREGPKTHRD
jgi:hypothetical protein